MSCCSRWLFSDLWWLLLTYCLLRSPNSIRFFSRDEICDENNKYVCPTCEDYQYCVFKKLSSYCNFIKWTYVFDNYLTIVFAVMMSFWATLFVNLWRRKESELKLKWNVQFKDIGTEPRQRYLDSAKGTKYNELSGKMEPVIPHYIQIFQTTCVVCVCLFMFYDKLSIWLTDIENPRTQIDYDSSVLYKRYILSFTNSYIPLFYIAFMKGKLYTIPHHHRLATYFERDTCQPSTCILGLCIQLAFLLLFKKFTGNLLIFLKYKFKRYFHKKSIVDEGQTTMPQYEQEYKLAPMNRFSLTSAYCQMVIDYGFVTFFVAAFPLAPLCVLLNNILECRSGAYKIVSGHRRPIPRKVPGIGSWGGVILGATYLSTATNAIVMGFTSDFVNREHYRMTKPDMHGYVNYTLSQFAIKDYYQFKDIHPGIDVCYYKGMRLPPSDPNKYALTALYWAKVTWKLIAVLIFEHLILLCNGVLGYAIPNIKSSVKQQLDMDRLLAREAKLHLKADTSKNYGSKATNWYFPGH